MVEVTLRNALERELKTARENLQTFEGGTLEYIAWKQQLEPYLEDGN